MRYDRDIAIVGAGPAGCSMAMQLAGAGFSVALIEKQAYPAHKLCGEFLSPESQASFHDLEVMDRIRSAAPALISRARVTTAAGAEFEELLPAPALGLSRHTLDALLFDAARRSGASCMDGTTVKSVDGDLDAGFRITTSAGAFHTRVVIGAFGKRSVVDRAVSERLINRPTGIVAFKMHFHGGSLPGTIELHAFRGGYCGLSEVEGGKLNVCWMSSDEVLKAAGGRPEHMLEATFPDNPMLRKRLEGLEPDWASLQSVAQVSLARKGVFRGDVCMVGDAAAMIAPLSGDGMAMALRSAEIAAPLVSSFLRREMSARELKARYGRQWKREFLARLWIGRLSHAAYVRPLLAGAAVRFLGIMPPAGRWLIRKTRGKAVS